MYVSLKYPNKQQAKDHILWQLAAGGEMTCSNHLSLCNVMGVQYELTSQGFYVLVASLSVVATLVKPIRVMYGNKNASGIIFNVS